MLRSRRANTHLLVRFNTWTSQRLLNWNPIPKLTIVLIWKTPACLKFGKTSNRAVENFPQRKLWFWAANAERCTLSAKNLIPPNFKSACFFGSDRSSHSRVRTRLITKSVYYEWASDSFAYLCPCNNSWYARSSPRVNEQSENKARATWERGRWRRKKCLSPAPARFSHFFFTDFVTTISEPGTGYGRPGVPSRCQSALQSLLAGYNSPKLFRTEANGDVPLDGVAFSRLD